MVLLRKWSPDILTIAVLLLLPLFVLTDDCWPVTWTKANVESETHVFSSDDASGSITYLDVAPGEINCRYWARTYEDVKYYTCTEISKLYSITTEFFFSLNPDLNLDCSNIKPRSNYCVDGCMCFASGNGNRSWRYSHRTCQIDWWPLWTEIRQCYMSRYGSALL